MSLDSSLVGASTPRRRRAASSALAGAALGLGLASGAQAETLLFFDPFDFSPLGQARSAISATGFLGGPALSGLGGFVDDLLGRYLASGRRFGFYPQAFNSDVYWGAATCNSSGVFYRFNNPFNFW
jgi:hypothetical protein